MSESLLAVDIERLATRLSANKNPGALPLEAVDGLTNPVGKAKSVIFTEEGARGSERLLKALFGRSPDQVADRRSQR